MNLQPGMTPEQIAAWRIENWTKERFAQQLLMQEVRFQELVQRYNELNRFVVAIGKELVRKGDAL